MLVQYPDGLYIYSTCIIDLIIDSDSIYGHSCANHASVRVIGVCVSHGCTEDHMNHWIVTSLIIVNVYAEPECIAAVE